VREGSPRVAASRVRAVKGRTVFLQRPGAENDPPPEDRKLLGRRVEREGTFVSRNPFRFVSAKKA
jgi:hypothetical protein